MDAIEKEDIYRCWLDSMEFGPLKQTHPFLSLLCSSSIKQTTESANRISDITVQLAYALKKKHDSIPALSSSSDGSIGNSSTIGKATRKIIHFDTSSSPIESIESMRDKFTFHKYIDSVDDVVHCDRYTTSDDDGGGCYSFQSALDIADTVTLVTKSLDAKHANEIAALKATQSKSGNSGNTNTNSGSSSGTSNDGGDGNKSVSHTSKYQPSKPVPQQQQNENIRRSNTNSNSNSGKNDGQKPNPFSSAKDKFIAEGGKIIQNNNNNSNSDNSNRKTSSSSASSSSIVSKEATLPEGLEGCDINLIEKIESEILHTGQPVTFDDIAGLEFAKKCVNELICWPMTRPDLFTGLRALPPGLLLFGPPGTGKTLIGKAIANQAGATFFSISSSSLTSKWIGEGEKLVKTLFILAAYKEPSVIFIDEVDSLLCQRSSDENEASRRLKTEFLVQLDGCGTSATARVVIVGATNRPEELDEAARRRFVKRIYIPLPDNAGRLQLFMKLLTKCSNDIGASDYQILVERSVGFSGADVMNLCTEAAMGPVREIAAKQHGNLSSINIQDVPDVSMNHFYSAMDTVTCSVSPDDLKRYIDWNNVFGSFRKME